MEHKHTNLRLLLTLAIILLALFVGVRLGQMNSPNVFGFTRSGEDKLSTFMEYLERGYVDSVDVEHLTEVAIPAMLKELDPHSVYIPASEMKRANEPLEGNFDGIGVSFNMPNDTVIIGNVIAGGPSEEANVYPGDRIITVNDSVIAGRKIPQDSVMKLLRGPSKTKVTIGVKRAGTPKLLSITITRGKIPIKSIDAAYMINAETGYIRMNKFARTTYEEFRATVDQFHAQGMKKIILDLRENSGGYLEQAFDIANEFLEKRSLIVYTEGRAYKRNNMYSKGNGSCLEDQLVILIDEGSASASEILAGAVQDHDRGLIVGRRSFGKGLVQEPIIFSDGSGIRLTIARYYTPSGRSIQRAYNHGMADYYNDILRRYEHGEMEHADSVQQADTTKYYTTGGRVVYGGGGITPDVFVPFDTTGVNDYFKALRRNNVFYDYALAFSDNNRKQLMQVKNIADLDKFFSQHDLLAGFEHYAARKGIRGTEKEKAESKTLIETHLRALIGRSTVLDEVGSVYYVNKIDSTVQKALSELK